MLVYLILGCGIVALTIACGVWQVTRLRELERRHLASLLIADISAALEALDTPRIILALDRALYDPDGHLLLGEIALPNFGHYEANAAKLDLLGAPLRQRIIDVFDRCAALPDEVETLEFLWCQKSLGSAGAAYRLQVEVIELQQRADENVLALRAVASAKPEDKH